MRIAVICDVLGEANNGTTIAALNLIRTLREKGHDVRVVCPDADRAGEPGYYIAPKYDFHIFNEYVEKNGVAPAKLDTRVLEEAVQGSIVRRKTSPTISSCKTAPRPTPQYTIYYTTGSTATATAFTTPPSSSRIPSKPSWAPPRAG